MGNGPSALIGTVGVAGNGPSALIGSVGVAGNGPSVLIDTVVVVGNGPSVLMLHLFWLDVSRLGEVVVQPKPKVAMISE